MVGVQLQPAKTHTDKTKTKIEENNLYNRNVEKQKYLNNIKKIDKATSNNKPVNSKLLLELKKINLNGAVQIKLIMIKLKQH